MHDSTESLKNGEEFLGHFFLGGEKYYFQANAKVSKDQYSIPLPEELYHLQRRQNYRVKVPEGYGAFYDIFSVNGKEQNMKGQVIDISSQGCRIIYKTKTPVMQLGDKVIGHLRIKDATPLELKGEVRHFKLDEGPHPAQTFGIEFTPINPIMENKLFAITLEIHKEFFR